MTPKNYQENPPTIGIASLNVLLDKTRSGLPRTDPHFVEPQFERIDSLSQTLGSLPISPDVVMLQEVQVTKDFHAGEQIAQRLGVGEGFWFNHNTSKRKGEFIGVCGKLVVAAEAIEIGYDKLAVITEIDDIAFIVTHLRRTYDRRIKATQMRSLLEQTEQYEKRVIVGDANADPHSEARKILRHAGAQSTYLMQTGRYPGTWPTSNYRDVMLKRHQQQIIRKPLSIDMLEVIGFERDDVLAAGRVDTPKSDHYAMYAELAT